MKNLEIFVYLIILVTNIITLIAFWKIFISQQMLREYWKNKIKLSKFNLKEKLIFREQVYKSMMKDIVVKYYSILFISAITNVIFLLIPYLFG